MSSSFADLDSFLRAYSNFEADERSGEVHARSIRSGAQLRCGFLCIWHRLFRLRDAPRNGAANRC